MTDVNRSNTTAVEELQELFDSERYDDLLTELSALRASSLGRLDPISRVKVCQLYSCSFREKGHYRKALVKIMAALRLSKPLRDDSLHASLKLDLGRVLINLGRFKEAVEELTESYVFFRRSGDLRSALRPLNSLAQVHHVAGNYRRSSEVLELFIESAERCSSAENIGVGGRNLVRVLLQMGELQKAKVLLTSMSSDVGDFRFSADLNTLRGLLCILELDLGDAAAFLSQGMHLYSQLGASRDLAVCVEYMGLTHYLGRNYSKARECYQQVLDSSEPTASAVAQTLRMLTDVYIAEGKFRKALSTAKEAEEAILRINERRELGALWRAYGQIHTHNGDLQTAREYFKKSTDLLREIGARYELALTYLACGRSESYDHDERLSHLHTARMHFVEMGVPRRVEQVDEAIVCLRSAAVPHIVTGKQKDDTATIIAVNPRMKEIIAYAEQVAKSDLNVLLTGETGTGKDLLAQHIHDMSGRTGDYVVVNVAAVPNEMIESELFGHRKGAFTGASEDKPGLFESAENGTMCLNEIADAALQLQVKLLEVLESRRIRRLGENMKRSVNFRLIAASNRDLDRLMSKGLFRLDLYHRLNEVGIVLPPLRERLDDIPGLVRHFLTNSHYEIKMNPDDERGIERLSAILTIHDYPGNVRELKAQVKKLMHSSGGDIAEMVRLAPVYSHLSEREQLARILELTNWNRSRTAWILDVSEGAVRNRIRKYEITRT